MNKELTLSKKGSKTFHKLLFESKPDTERVKIIEDAIRLFPINQDIFILDVDLN